MDELYHNRYWKQVTLARLYLYHFSEDHVRSTADDRGKSQNMKWCSPLTGCILKYQIYKLRLDLLFFNKLQHTTEWLVFVCCQKC